VAIATVGNPPIILLDEPSAGMDPKARRFMWDVVANIASNKTSAVILTTHLMEEAEALCTKIGIMVR
jgi:ABC-type multidrug transport system ATPase subunit